MLTVIEEHDAENKIDILIKKYPRISDVYDRIKWRLARAPDSGEKVERDYYIIRSTDMINIKEIPRLIVLYSFNEVNVNIFMVKEFLK